MTLATLCWYEWRAFDPDTLYALLRLRSAVFVVEQACVFLDPDGLDPHCAHLIAVDDAGDLVGALRLVPPGLKRPQSASPAAAGPALGRLVTAAPVRRTGLGRRLMVEGLRRCAHQHPGVAVSISAQAHLLAFYAGLGFTPVGAPYDEDRILHVDLRRP